MPAKKTGDAATMEVVAVVPIHHGTPEFPEVATPGTTVTLDKQVAEVLLAKGDALKPKDVPADVDPAALVAAANTIGAKP